MSKRPFEMDDSQSSYKKPRVHWTMGLSESMKDPKFIYKETENTVVIYDKFPKAKIHYLVLPRVQINSIFYLNQSHISLLEEFGSVFETIKEENKDWELRAGFHAVPTMQWLHMHVISKDMISDRLKTKAQFNSFNTSFFIPYNDLLERLKEEGVIQRISLGTHKSLLYKRLKCNQCDFHPLSMPQLKQHLLSHAQQK